MESVSRFMKNGLSVSKWMVLSGQLVSQRECITTLAQKRKSSPFHLQILNWPEGAQEWLMSHFYPLLHEILDCEIWVLQLIKVNYTDQKKLLPDFSRFKFNKRGVSFLGECIPFHFEQCTFCKMWMDKRTDEQRISCT